MMRLMTGLILTPIAALAAACTTATPDCTEWVALGGGPARSLIYRTHPLDVKNETITRATVIIHGTNRDAHNYYRTGVAAAFLAGALEDTVVIAPRIASNGGGACMDKLAENEVSYACGGDSWRSGGASSGSKWTSFDFTDEILRKLARKDVW